MVFQEPFVFISKNYPAITLTRCPQNWQGDSQNPRSGLLHSLTPQLASLACLLRGSLSPRKERCCPLLRPAPPLHQTYDAFMQMSCSARGPLRAADVLCRRGERPNSSIGSSTRPSGQQLRRAVVSRIPEPGGDGMGQSGNGAGKSEMRVWMRVWTRNGDEVVMGVG